jgi:hypothetical protein
MGRTLLLGSVYAGRRMAVDPMEGGAVRQKWSYAGPFTGAGLTGSRSRYCRHRYLEIRRNLVRLFEWRGCSTPDEYADETINRCAKDREGRGDPRCCDLPHWNRAHGSSGNEPGSPRQVRPRTKRRSLARRR